MPNPAIRGFVTSTRTSPSWNRSSAAALSSGDCEPSTRTASGMAWISASPSSFSPCQTIHWPGVPLTSSTVRAMRSPAVALRTAARSVMPFSPPKISWPSGT